MLSFFDLLIFVTTTPIRSEFICLLWFAFILWSTDICYNGEATKRPHSALWFAFILWSTDICYNRGPVVPRPRAVVICFHSLIYWYLLQQSLLVGLSLSGCDLLSFFDLLIFVTTRYDELTAAIRLWFAFILWSTDICYNQGIGGSCKDWVVICFHSLIYWYLLQLNLKTNESKISCDLLSFFDLLIFVTTHADSFYQRGMLWFAFILWSTDICYNIFLSRALQDKVVICFHSLIYWYLLQL